MKTGHKGQRFSHFGKTLTLNRSKFSKLKNTLVFFLVAKVRPQLGTVRDQYMLSLSKVREQQRAIPMLHSVLNNPSP